MKSFEDSSHTAALFPMGRFGEMPTLVKDRYWNTTEVHVPYTSASALARRMSVNNIGSTMNLK